MDRRTFQGVIFSMGLGLLLAGCGGGDDGYQPVSGSQPEVPEPPGHHDEEGPHGGHVYDLGDHEYLAEVVFDDQTRKITVYVLNHDDTSQPVPMDAAGATLSLHVEGEEQPVELSLTAVPQEGDPEGQASLFEVAGDQVPESITSEEQLDARLSFTRGEQSYSALIEPHEHEHDHDHEDGHDEDDHEAGREDHDRGHDDHDHDHDKD